MDKSSRQCSIVHSVKDTFAKAGEVYAKKALSEISNDVAFFAYHEGGLTAQNFAQKMMQFSITNASDYQVLTEFKKRVDDGLKATKQYRAYYNTFLESLNNEFKDYFRLNSDEIERDVQSQIKARTSPSVSALMDKISKYAPDIKRYDTLPTLIKKITKQGIIEVFGSTYAKSYIAIMANKNKRNGVIMTEKDIKDRFSRFESRSGLMVGKVIENKKSLTFNKEIPSFENLANFYSFERKKAFREWWNTEGKEYVELMQAPFHVRFNKGIEMLSSIPGIEDEIEGLKNALKLNDRKKYYKQIAQKLAEQAAVSALNRHGTQVLSKIQQHPGDWVQEAYDDFDDKFFDVIDRKYIDLFRDAVDLITDFDYYGEKPYSGELAWEHGERTIDKIQKTWWREKKKEWKSRQT